MGSLTSRGRALVVVAFLVSAALCATSAVALVRASRDEGTPTAQSSPTPSPSATESPTPSPTASPTPVVTAAPTPTATVAPTTAPTPSATASRAPRPTSSPHATRSPAAAAGLFLDAVLDPANGTVPGQVVGLFAHATDGDGTIHLVSVDWGDGTKVSSGTVTKCAATGKGDCKDFALHHSYSAYDTYTVTITVASAGTIPETSSLSITEYVNGPSPSPSPTA